MIIKGTVNGASRFAKSQQLFDGPGDGLSIIGVDGDVVVGSHQYEPLEFLVVSLHVFSPGRVVKKDHGRITTYSRRSITALAHSPKCRARRLSQDVPGAARSKANNGRRPDSARAGNNKSNCTLSDVRLQCPS